MWSDDDDEFGPRRRLCRVRRKVPGKGVVESLEFWPPRMQPKIKPVAACYPIACEFPYYCCPPFVLCPRCGASGVQMPTKPDDSGDDGGQPQSVPPPLDAKEEKKSSASPPKPAKEDVKPNGEQPPEIRNSGMVVQYVLAPEYAAKASKKKKKRRDFSSEGVKQSDEDEDHGKPPAKRAARPSWDGVKIHYCYRCGRFRSTEFHDAHPLMPGGKPLVGLCGKCKAEPSQHTAFGRASGKVVGERWVITPHRSRKIPRNDKDASGPPKHGSPSHDRRLSPRIVELSSSASSSESMSECEESADEVVEAKKSSTDKGKYVNDLSRLILTVCRHEAYGKGDGKVCG